MKRKCKVFGTALLTTLLVLGSSFVALAAKNDRSVDSGSEKIGNYVVAYASQVGANNGLAYTDCGDSSASLSVDAIYYYYNNTNNYIYNKNDSNSGRVHVQVNFNAPTGYTTYYLTATHNATVGSSTMNPKTTIAVYE